MCLDLALFYLTAVPDYYEYMKMPLNLFPQWIIDQYGLNTHAADCMIHIEMGKAVWGLPQAGILSNKKLCRELEPQGTKNTRTRLVSVITRHDLFHSPWSSVISA